MTRPIRIAVGILAVWVALALYWLRGVQHQVAQLEQPAPSEERARREVTQPAVASPSDAAAKAILFWAAEDGTGLRPVEIELPLSPDPAQRAMQLLDALATRAPSDRQRTLPLDTALLEFYLLVDGTAIADFSDALARSVPSGILSEQLAVDSITRTLAANVKEIRRVKIVIQGQEAETLAGHVDLTRFFELRAPQSDEKAAAAKLEEAPAPKQP